MRRMAINNNNSTSDSVLLCHCDSLDLINEAKPEVLPIKYNVTTLRNNLRSKFNNGVVINGNSSNYTQIIWSGNTYIFGPKSTFSFDFFCQPLIKTGTNANYNQVAICLYSIFSNFLCFYVRMNGNLNNYMEIILYRYSYGQWNIIGKSENRRNTTDINHFALVWNNSIFNIFHNGENFANIPHDAGSDYQLTHVDAYPFLYPSDYLGEMFIDEIYLTKSDRRVGNTFPVPTQPYS